MVRLLPPPLSLSCNFAKFPKVFVPRSRIVFHSHELHPIVLHSHRVYGSDAPVRLSGLNTRGRVLLLPTLNHGAGGAAGAELGTRLNIGSCEVKGRQQKGPEKNKGKKVSGRARGKRFERRIP